MASAWKYALGYNIPLIPHYLSHQVLGQADRIMINSICGSAYTAMYTVAYQISMVLNIVTNAICNSFTPWAYMKLKEKDGKDIGNLTLIIEIATGLVAFFSHCLDLSLFTSWAEMHIKKLSGWCPLCV